VVKRNNIDFEFIVESVAYVLYTANEEEAYYLTAILNSTAPNALMKDFQAKGLFGARHVHKKILDIYFPKFDANEPLHVQLAQLGQTSHAKAALYLKENPPKQALTAMHLGRLRTTLKKHLTAEMEAIDQLVKGLIG